MKIKEFEQLKMKSREELLKLAQDHRDKLRGLRFDFAMQKLQNVMTIKTTRKDLARILTILGTK